MTEPLTQRPCFLCGQLKYDAHRLCPSCGGDDVGVGMDHYEVQTKPCPLCGYPKDPTYRLCRACGNSPKDLANMKRLMGYVRDLRLGCILFFLPLILFCIFWTLVYGMSIFGF